MKNSLLVIAILLVLAGGCRYQETAVDYPGVNTFKRGEKFRVNLPENHTNKENWLITSEHFSSAKHLNAVWHGNEKGIDFNFEAIRAGTDTLTFVLRQVQDTVRQHRVIVQVTD